MSEASKVGTGEKVLKSYGFGLTKLRKLAKKIGRVRSHFENEGTWTRIAMGSVLMGIGKGNKVLDQFSPRIRSRRF